MMNEQDASSVEKNQAYAENNQKMMPSERSGLGKYDSASRAGVKQF